MTVTAAKTALVVFDEVLETFETQDMLLGKVSKYEPNAAEMQNSANVVTRQVSQHAPIINGWDLTGQETGIIQESYQVSLGEPANDFVENRADDMRDMRFWQERGRRSGMQQATECNKRIADVIRTQGSMYYESNSTSGYDYISEAQALMNERQGYKSQRNFLLNDRSTQKFGQDLAARQTLQGQPAQTWSTGQIGQNVAQFDVFTGSFLPYITGGAASTTASGDQSFAPTAGTVTSDGGIVTNTDYRYADVSVADSSSFAAGDKVNAGNIQSVGLADKSTTGQLMTFTIAEIVDATTIKISPKPIAADDSANLSVVELAYANVDTTITDGATITKIDDTAGRSDLFWDEEAVEVLAGNIPADLFSQFDGKQVLNSTMSNGVSMYMVYDGDIATMTFRYRLFTWYNPTMRDPSRAGVAYSA